MSLSLSTFREQYVHSKASFYNILMNKIFYSPAAAVATKNIFIKQNYSYISLVWEPQLSFQLPKNITAICVCFTIHPTWLIHLH